MKKKNKKTLQGKTLSAVVALCVILCIGLAKNCDGNELPADVNGGHVFKSSQERTAELVEKEEAKKKAEEEIDENLQEAPSEGIQRKVYEDLEQPAPIIGKREVLIFKNQYIVSYNTETLCPNYVCWILTEDRIRGNVKRTDDFYGDPALNEENRVETTDYNGSGYDRGHMCPAGDNKNSETVMRESFAMTNICPQANNLNRGDWNELESKCRDWVKKYGTLYICCGPIFDSKNPKKIGKRKNLKISVPDRFFKVVLCLDDNPKAIGFVYPNNDTNKPMRSYAVSVDEVEKITGIDFYPQLDDAEEKALEAKCNPSEWGI